MYSRYAELQGWKTEVMEANMTGTGGYKEKKLREYSKEQSDLQETVEVYRRYRSASEQLSDAKAMLEEKLDSDMREMVKEEISELQEEIESLTDQLKYSKKTRLLPITAKLF
ncbi:PCRF domain-containing protein [Bacillus licheniformis]|nr:PCRF domain-containing protein [Bacillus licheniformis]